MPNRRQWSLAADQVIKDMRVGGATWAAIGERLGLSRNTVIERGRRIHAEKIIQPRTVIQEINVSDEPNRLPLRAGHPLTWGLISNQPFPQQKL
jgi:DNA-binding Lrp family transcriptional regulator